MPSVFSDRLLGVESSTAIKAPARLATTAPITLSGLQAIDAVALVAGDRVLVKNQTDLTENGIWIAATGAWTRAIDCNGARDLWPGTQVLVTEGITQQSQIYVLDAVNPILIGSSDLVFEQLAVLSSSGPKSITEASGAVVSGGISTVDLSGRVAAGDGGGAQYKAVASEPTHPFKFQSADGRWWEIVVDTKPKAEQFGIGLGATDDRVNTQAMYDLVGQKEVDFLRGPYNYPTPAGYDVYLMAGDGWMSGNNAGPVDGTLDATDARILQYSYTDGTVKLASQPFQAAVFTVTGVSPALDFAKQMLTKTSANRGIILVPASNVSVNGSTDWTPGNASYTRAVTGINAALSYAGGTNRFIGVIHAGSAYDVSLAKSEATVGAELSNMMTGLRTDIAGASKACLVCAQFITEYASGAAGTAIAKIHKHIVGQRATSTKPLTGYLETGHRTTAAGSRLLGTNLANAMLKILPYDFGNQFFTVSGYERKAYALEDAVFVPARPQGIVARFVRANAPTLTDTRGFHNLTEMSDDLRARDTKGQWAGNIMCDSYYGFSKSWGYTAPNSPQTTLHSYAIGLPDGNGNVGGIGACTIILGRQNGWGGIDVISNSKEDNFPQGYPTAMIGREIDVQPAAGSNLTGGAGLLVNSFTDPVGFAGVAIVGDAGGAWQDGIFLGNCTRYGFYINSAFQGQNGLYYNDATFTDSAISLGAGATNGIKITSAGITSNIYKENGTGALIFENGATTSIRNGTTEGNLILSLARADGTESIRGYLSTGTAANAAAATIKMRANSVTGRSLNAGGTINASGADYAEYEYLGKGVSAFTKGDIVGFDEDGLLTDKWAKAIRFGIKSTNPCLIGGDLWSDHVEIPVEPVYAIPCAFEHHSFGERPYVNQRTAHIAPEYMLASQEQWDADVSGWEAEREAHRQDWKASVYAEYEVALAEAMVEVEKARATVERIAYCGKVPVNVLGAIPGQHVLACKNGSGIGVVLVNSSDLTFEQSQQSVGRVNRILPDGRAEVVVRVG